MGRKRVDIAGKVFGNVKALEWHSSPKGKSTRWVCECLNCGNIYDMPLSSLRTEPKSCLNCKMNYREYAPVELKCLVCGRKIKAQGNHPSRTCSSECKRQRLTYTTGEWRRASLEKTLQYLVNQAKSRAKRQGRDYDLDLDWALKTLEEQDYKCYRTGIELGTSRKDETGRSKIQRDTISLDRIDSSKGYTKDNCQIVCYHYNIAKNRFTDGELYELCKAVINRREELEQNS